MQIEVKRRELKFKPDFSRVIARFFYMNDDRALGIIKAVLEMSEDESPDSAESGTEGFFNAS